MQETREAIRARLLHDGNVQRAIQMRAYEIWQLRGRYDGRSNEDWMLAENEVLSFLTEQEMKKAIAHTTTQALAITEVEIVEEVVVAEPAINAIVEATPVAVAAEIEAAPVAEPFIEEAPAPAEIPEMGIVLEPVKRASRKAAPKAPKGSKSAAKKEAAPKKTASRKKAATTEVESAAQAVAVESQPESPAEKENAPKKAASKRTTTPKTTAKKTTRKSAKPEQPSAK